MSNLPDTDNDEFQCERCKRILDIEESVVSLNGGKVWLCAVCWDAQKTNDTTTHTPGPWREFRDDDSHDVMTLDGMHICRIEPVNSVNPEREQEANGRLIAAAPDLLAAADYAVRVLADRMVPYRDGDDPNIDLLGECLRELRDAIAKAEGRDA